MTIADQSGKPISVYTASATLHATKFVEKTLENLLVDELPKVLIGDKDWDSDDPDQKLLDKYAIKPVVSNRKSVIRLKMKLSAEIPETLES